MCHVLISIRIHLSLPLTLDGAIIDRHTGIEVAAMKAPPPEMRDATYYDPERNVFDARLG